MLTGSVSWDLESPCSIGHSEVVMRVVRACVRPGFLVTCFLVTFFTHTFATASSSPLCCLQRTVTSITYTSVTLFRRRHGPTDALR